jgi:hypothetical protein
MAGHFLLKSISTAEKDAIIAGFTGTTWSATAHVAGTANGAGGDFPGWTAGSRLTLGHAFAGIAIANRNNLPPHKYLQFPGTAAPSPAQLTAIHSSNDLREITHPDDPGLGLRALCATALAEWNAGKKLAALIEQIKHGATSIEIYYLGKQEIL